MLRRDFVLGAALPFTAFAASPEFRFSDVTAAAGIHFQHNNGAFGPKYLPETTAGRTF
jgi:hypothetical protein